MKQNAGRDAGSVALRRRASFLRGTRVSYVNRGVPLQELELCPVRCFGERDAHAARLPSPCPVCIPQEHDEGERTEEPGVAHISRP